MGTCRYFKSENNFPKERAKFVIRFTILTVKIYNDEKSALPPCFHSAPMFGRMP